MSVDGSQGEGGGQVLRTSLALSLVTGRPLRIERIRASRPKPGLRRQHLTAVRAATAVGEARVKGAELGSRFLEFVPRTIRGGSFHFAVGTAGSTTLVLQTVLPALLQATEPSSLLLEGGTHNPFAPPFGFLEKSFLPALRCVGARVEAELERPGFFPTGGGRLKVRIEPQTERHSLLLLQRGPVIERKAVATVAAIRSPVADRELRVLGDELGFDRSQLERCILPPELGPGNTLTISFGFRCPPDESSAGTTLSAVFTRFGEKRVRAEKVAEKAVHAARHWLQHEVPVDEHLADQLLLPMALSAGGRFRTTEPTEHTRTHLRLLRELLGTQTECRDLGGGRWEIALAA